MPLYAIKHLPRYDCTYIMPRGCKPINFGIVIPNLFHMKQSKLCIIIFGIFISGYFIPTGMNTV